MSEETNNSDSVWIELFNEFYKGLLDDYHYENKFIKYNESNIINFYKQNFERSYPFKKLNVENYEQVMERIENQFFIMIHNGLNLEYNLKEEFQKMIEKDSKKEISSESLAFYYHFNKLEKCHKIFGVNPILTKILNEDLCGPNDKIDQVKLPPNSYHHVTISEVVSSSTFYVQLLINQQDLTKLMDSLNIFFSEDSNLEKYSIKSTSFELVGLNIVAPYIEGSKILGWNRAIITNIEGAEELKVLFIDYGQTACIDLKYCKWMPKKFLQSPAQAKKVKLINANETQMTPNEFLEFRSNIVENPEYHKDGILVVAKNEKEVQEVELFDIHKKSLIIVNNN